MARSTAEPKRELTVARVVGHGVSVSFDGFMAGPQQSLEAPLGVGGERLHEWAFATRSMRAQHGMDGGEDGLDDRWARRALDGIGATIMGRNMFGPVRGAWPDEGWRGWWGSNPPFHHPVFVLTHHDRQVLVMEGGTSFHFVTAGIHEALRRAKDAAGQLDVRVGGGAATIRQFLESGLIDELHIAVVPILLGGGEPLFETSASAIASRYECAEFQGSPRVSHVLLRRRRTR